MLLFYMVIVQYSPTIIEYHIIDYHIISRRKKQKKHSSIVEEVNIMMLYLVYHWLVDERDALAS